MQWSIAIVMQILKVRSITWNITQVPYLETHTYTHNKQAAHCAVSSARAQNKLQSDVRGHLHPGPAFG